MSSYTDFKKRVNEESAQKSERRQEAAAAPSASPSTTSAYQQFKSRINSGERAGTGGNVGLYSAVKQYERKLQQPQKQRNDWLREYQSALDAAYGDGDASDTTKRFHDLLTSFDEVPTAGLSTAQRKQWQQMYDDLASYYSKTGSLAPFASQRAAKEYYAQQEGSKQGLPQPGTTLPKGETSQKEEKGAGEKLWNRFMGSLGTPQIIGTTTSPYELTTDTGYKEPTKEWTQEERDVYEALKLGNQENADRFATDTNNSINKEKRAQEQKQAQEWGKEHKAIAWGANTFSGVASMGMGDFLNAGMERAIRGEVTEKEHATPRQLAEAASGGASQGLNEKYGTIREDIPVVGGKGLGEIYQLTQSIAQSMALAHATGGLGKAGAYMTDAVFFGNSAASAFDDAKQRGATDDQAYLFGALNGVNEALGEHLSIENLITMKNPHTFAELAKNVLKQAGIEGSEEAFTTVLNSFAEQFVMKDKSSFYDLVNEYTAQGMDEKEAKKKAWLSLANDMAFDFVGGAFSGGVSGGLQSGYNYITSNTYASRYYRGSQQELVQKALDINPDNQIAKKAQEYIKQGKNVPGNLLSQMIEMNDSTVLRKTVKARLEELGEAGDLEKLTEAVIAGASEEGASGKQRKALKSSQFGQQVAQEVKKGSIWDNTQAENTEAAPSHTETMQRETQTAEAGAEQAAAPAEQAAERRNAVTEERTPAPQGTETKDNYRNNDSGQAYLLGSREPVNIRKVAAVENGNLTLELDTGETVDGKDISFGSFGEARLYQAVASMGVDADTANSVLSMQKNSSLSQTAYASAAQEAYQLGRRGVEFEKIRKASPAAYLSEGMRRDIWEMGRASAQAQNRQREAILDSGSHKTATAGLRLDQSVKEMNSFSRQQKTAMELSKALSDAGLPIEVYASTAEQRANGMENGSFSTTDGSIRFDINAGRDGSGTAAYVLGHEVTHFAREFGAGKYQTMLDTLVAAVGETDTSYEGLLDRKIAELRKMEAYKSLSETELGDIAQDEVVAEMFETVFTDTDAAQRLSQSLYAKDKTLWGKFKEFVSGLVERLREAYKGLNPDSAIARQMKDTVAQSEQVLNAWVEAVSEAVENYRLQDGERANSGQETRLSAREQKTAESLVSQLQEHRQELSNMEPVAEVDGTELNKELRPVDAAMEYVRSFGGKVLRADFGEVRFSKTKIKSGLVGHGIGNAKMETFAAVPAVIREGKQIGHADNWKNSHKESYVFAAPITYNGEESYVGVIVEKDNQSGMYYVHEAVDSGGNVFSFGSKKEESTSDRLLTLPGRGDTVADSSENRVAQENGEVKGNVRYSARQGTKNLVALHNLTEEKFLKTLELGGFPMPSIAITKADIPHTNFGDITVVFGKDTIDPKANRKNTAYSADAWTPTVPRIEYEVDSKVADRVYNRLGTLKNQVADYFQRDIDKLRYDLEDRLNREGGEENLTKSLSDNYALKAAFLEEQGRHIEQKTRQEERTVNAISSETEDKLLKVWDVLGDVEPEVFEHMPLKTLREEYGAELEKAYPGMTKSAMRMSGVLRRLSSYLNGTANSTETYTVADGEAMKNAVDAAIDQKSYENWVKELFSGAEKSRGIYNGKERYTPSGNLGSFKATHIPATLDGIVQAMAAENGGNSKSVSGFNGIGTLRAATAEEFKSIADMHKREGRLQNLTEDQAKQIQGNLENRLYQLMNAIDEANPSSRLSGNSFVRMDGIGENLVEVCESGNYTPENIKRIFAKYGMEVSNQTAQEVVQLLFDVTQMPVNVFEAKPKRAVGFDEIKNVLVPDTASQKLIQELDSRGIPYQTYEAGNEAQRQRLVDQMENIRFSQRQEDALKRQNERQKEEIGRLRELVDIQKYGNKDFTLDQNSVKRQALDLMNAVGAKGKSVEFSAILGEFYRNIGTNRELSWEDVSKSAQKAVDWLMDNKKQERDPYSQEILDWMKGRHVALSEDQVNEATYLYGSLKEFRKAIKGTIVLDQTANTSLDQFWQEAADQYGDKFGSDTNAGDMPGALAELVDSLRNGESVGAQETKYYEREIRQDLTRQVYDSYWNVKPVGSVRDDMQKKMDLLKAEHTRAMEDARQALKDERANGKQAIEDYRKQRDIVETTMMAAYAQQRDQVERAYTQEMEDLRKTYGADTATYQEEFFTAMKNSDFQGAKSPSLRRMLNELAHDNSLGNKDAEAARKQVYDNLRQQYELENDIGKLEDKVRQQREAAHEKVESRRRTELRRKIYKKADTFRRMALTPGKGDTLHAPVSLMGALADFCDVFYQSEANAAAEKWQALNSRESAAMRLDNQKKQERELGTIQNQRELLGRRAAAVEALRDAYGKLKGDSALSIFHDDHVQGMVDNLSKLLGESDISGMSASQLEEVYGVMKAMEYTIVNANKVFSAGKDKTLIGMTNKLTAEIKAVDVKHNPLMNKAREYFMWQMRPDTFFSYLCGYGKENEGKAIQKMFVNGSERMLGVQREFYQLFRPLTEATDKKTQKAVKELIGNPMKDMVYWGLKDANGQEVKTSKGMAMQAYLLLSQEDSFNSILHGGFKLPNAKEYYKGNVGAAYSNADSGSLLSQAIGENYKNLVHDIQEAQAPLKDLEKQIKELKAEPDSFYKREQLASLEDRRQTAQKRVNELQTQAENMTAGAAAELIGIRDKLAAIIKADPAMSALVDIGAQWYKRTGELLAEVYEGMYGYRPNLVDRYTPIHRDLTNIKTDVREDNGKAFNLENIGLTKERVPSYAPIRLTDFFQELSNHTGEISRFYGFAQVQKDFNRIWNLKMPGSRMTANSLVADKYGAGKALFGVSGEEYVNNYIKSVAGSSGSGSVLDKFYGAAASATLSINPRVAISQAASIPTAAAEVGWGSMARGFAKGLQTALSGKGRAQLANDSIWFWQRYRGAGGSTEIGDLKYQGNLWARVSGSKAGKTLFNWCQAMDVFSTASMWAMAEDAVQHQHGLNPGTEGYQEAVTQKYADIIRNTQPNYTTTERSDLLRDKREGMKLLTMYKTQSNQNLNILMDSWGEYKAVVNGLKNGDNRYTQADRKAAGRRLANGVTSVTIGGTLAFVLMRTAVNLVMGNLKYYRDDDTDEVTRKGILGGMLGEVFSSVAGMFALGGQLEEIIYSAVTGGRYYGISDSAIGVIATAAEDGQKVLATIFDQESEPEARTEKMKKYSKNLFYSTMTAFGVPAKNMRTMLEAVDTWFTAATEGIPAAMESGDTTDTQYQARILRGWENGDMEKIQDTLAILAARSDEGTDEKIQKDVTGGVANYLKKQYQKGKVSGEEAQKLLEYIGHEDPEGIVQKWEFQEEHPESKLSDTGITKWSQNQNIPLDVFEDAYRYKGEHKKTEVVSYIRGLSISDAMKRQLWDAIRGSWTSKDTPW